MSPSRCRRRPRPRPEARIAVAIRLHATPDRTRGHLLADAQGRVDGPSRRPHPGTTDQRPGDPAGHPDRHPRALPLSIRPPAGDGGSPGARGRRLRGVRCDRQGAGSRRAQEHRRPLVEPEQRLARVRAREARRSPTGGRRRRGPLRLLAEVLARPGGLPARPPGPRPDPLSRDPDRVRRDASTGRGVDVPLARRGTGRGRGLKHRTRDPGTAVERPDGTPAAILISCPGSSCRTRRRRRRRPGRSCRRIERGTHDPSECCARRSAPPAIPATG